MNDLVNKINDLTVFSGREGDLFALFSLLRICSETYSHPPVFTVEEGDAMGVHDRIPGQGGKSLLLTNKTGQLWLVMACDDTRVNIKGLARHIGSGRLSFAKPEVMEQVMGVRPGSATPFALINDTERKISVVIDDRFMETPLCTFHPLRNDLSTVIKFEDLRRFLTHLQYNPVIMPLTGDDGSA